MESWQQRYFVLEGAEMAYYKHQAHVSASEGPRGSIQLASALVSLRTDSKVRFDIDDAMGRCWHLRASTEEEAASWVAALKKVKGVHFAKEAKAKEAKPEKTASSADTPSRSLLGGVCGGGSEDADHKPTSIGQVTYLPTDGCPFLPQHRLKQGRSSCAQVGMKVGSAFHSAKAGIQTAREGGSVRDAGGHVALNMALPATDSCCPKLTLSERLYGWGGCIVLGIILNLVGNLFWILGNRIGFALTFTAGNVCSCAGWWLPLLSHLAAQPTHSPTDCSDLSPLCRLAYCHCDIFLSNKYSCVYAVTYPGPVRSQGVSFSWGPADSAAVSLPLAGESLYLSIWSQWLLLSSWLLSASSWLPAVLCYLSACYYSGVL